MEKITKEFILHKLENGSQKLSSTHAKLSLPIICRIYKKMVHGIKFEDIKVCEHLIIDGHHRYISAVLADISLDKAMSARTSATVEYNWENVEFLDEEWDTEEKIRRLNELDAQFNNIPLERIIEITK